MVEIEMPAEFKKACRNLGQDLDSLPDVVNPDSPLPGLVALALIGIDQTDARIIRSYLKTVLSGQYSAEEFREFWWTTPADTVFIDGQDVEKFLLSLLAAIEQPPYVPDLGAGRSAQ